MAGHLEEQQRRLEELAHRDPLTELANHRRFQELLARAVDEARRRAAPSRWCCSTSTTSSASTRPAVIPMATSCSAAPRPGCGQPSATWASSRASAATSSAIVLPDADGPRAFALAEAARTAVEMSPPVSGALRCSAGVACYPDDAKSAGALLQLAGGALAWAKESGAGAHAPLRPRARLRRHRGAARGLRRPDRAAGVVRPVFQPIVSLASGEPVGYEALARFDGKPGLPPSWWFSQAHRFGLGAALEAEAVRAALAARGRPPGTFLSINLSPSALASAEVARAAAGRPARARARDHRGGARVRRRGAPAPPRAAARARRADRGRRRRRGLRRACSR